MKPSLLRNQLILSLSVASVALGFMLAVQYRITQANNEKFALNTGGGEVAQLQASIKNIQSKNKELEKQIEQYNQQKMDYEKAAGSEAMDLRQQLEKARIEAGTTAVVGNGIQFAISDDPNLQSGPAGEVDHYVHDADVRQVLTELYLAGAEAVAINGQRVTYASRIECVGPTIMIDDHKSTVPFVFQAIGDKATLTKSMNLPNGLLDSFRKRKLKVEPVKEENNIRLPAYTGTFNNILQPGQKSKVD